jgi:hypothetical protein
MPLITITASFGTNGNEIAQIVAQNLGVGLFDDKRLQSVMLLGSILIHRHFMT